MKKILLDLVKSNKAYQAGHQGSPVCKEYLFLINQNLVFYVALAMFLNDNIDYYIDPSMLPLITKIQQ